MKHFSEHEQFVDDLTWKAVRPWDLVPGDLIIFNLNYDDAANMKAGKPADASWSWLIISTSLARSKQSDFDDDREETYCWKSIIAINSHEQIIQNRYTKRSVLYPDLLISVCNIDKKDGTMNHES